MTDINAFIAALKSTWLRKLVVEKHSQWSALLQANVSIENMLSLGTSYITEKIMPKIKNKFWKDVFLSHIQIIISKPEDQWSCKRSPDILA